MNYNFTFIIGYRNKFDRLNILRKTIDWVNSFSGAQIILVEQDKHSKISNLNLNCKHIFTKSEKPFNKSWAFNVGLKYAQSDIIIFGDSDIIMQPNDFINGINAIRQFEAVSPYSSVVDLLPNENNYPFGEIFNINRPGRGENDNQKINLCGGIIIFRREAINRIAGFSEDFWSWGCEDDYQTIKVKNFLTWTELNAKCYHFHHNKQEINRTLYTRNLQILQKAGNMSKEELAKSINNSRSKIGLLNKCDV
jgi:glycosyltransferase involved in cell wall biosynthesis